ncbi:hypothetical protein BGZ49_004808 [Haplosporangium sp. Z 27]|nr:hypothetical protein BGZ49_004808 [Haplosporangium sp. Z 27]
MKDDIVVDRSPIVDQYLPPKPKPAQQGDSKSMTGQQGEGLTKKQILLQNNIALHKKYENMVLDWTLILCDPVSEDTLGEADIKGKFRISLNERKVFDISELKKYCSSTCLSASRWFETQLTEEPLYLMDSESAYLRTTRVPIVPLGMDITAKNSPENETKPAPAFRLPKHGLEAVSSSSSGPSTTSTSSQMISHSIGNQYVQSLLASVPETPSFIKIVERDTTSMIPIENLNLDDDRDMQDAFDSDDDDDGDDDGDNGNKYQHDTVEGFRVPVKSKPKISQDKVRIFESDTKILAKQMSQVTLSDDQQNLRRSASSTSMDTQP